MATLGPPLISGDLPNLARSTQESDIIGNLHAQNRFRGHFVCWFSYQRVRYLRDTLFFLKPDAVEWVNFFSALVNLKSFINVQDDRSLPFPLDI